MASGDFFIFVPGSSVTNYYLHGDGGAWSGSGTPWTAKATSPYELSINEVTGRWTPQTTAAELISVGERPFAVGSTPLYKGYGNVVETFPLQIRFRSSVPDDALILKRQLWRILNGTVPCAFGVKPSGQTDTGYTLIYKADIQESESFIGEESGTNIMRCLVTWERAPFFGRLGGGETSLSGSSLTSTGSGAANVVAFAAATYGDLLAEGQPIELTFNPAQAVSLVFFASIHAATYSTTGAAALSTSSQTGTQTALNSITITDLDYTRIRGRSVMRFSNNTSNVQIRIEVRGHTSGTLLFAGPWITPTSGIASIVDMGPVPLSIWRNTSGTNAVQLYIGYRSTDGSSATTTLTSNEFLQYYEFCRLDCTITPASNPTQLNISSFLNATNMPALPRIGATACTRTSATALFDTVTPKGQVPRLRSGTSLWALWQRSTGHNTGDTATVDVSYAPLWTTFRGDDGT